MFGTLWCCPRASPSCSRTAWTRSSCPAVLATALATAGEDCGTPCSSWQARAMWAPWRGTAGHAGGSSSPPSSTHAVEGQGGAERRSVSQPPCGAPLPTFGTQPEVGEYVFKIRWWMRFVVAVLDRDMEVAKMEDKTARRPLPLPDLVGWRCSSWRNSFEVQEAVRALSLAVTRAREIHGQNVEGL